MPTVVRHLGLAVFVTNAATVLTAVGCMGLNPEQKTVPLLSASSNHYSNLDV